MLSGVPFMAYFVNILDCSKNFGSEWNIFRNNYKDIELILIHN